MQQDSWQSATMMMWANGVVAVQACISRFDSRTAIAASGGAGMAGLQIVV